MKVRKLPDSFACVLLLGVLIGFAFLYAGSITDILLFKTVMLLISLTLVFFSLHPLAHYAAGLAFHVRTRYFFLSRSDFSKLGGSLGKLGNAIPTIGVKFDSERLKTTGRSRRAILFGVGAIASNVGMLVILLISVALDYGLVPSALGTLFFLASLGTELLFSTKVGDLNKMRRARSLP